MVVRWTLIPALGAVAALGACGGLETPDLTVGGVAGRVANASVSGGYVYVLGAPDRYATLAADGSYEVAQVPVGPRQLVVVSAAGGIARAELVPVEVSSGMLTLAPERDAETMSHAGRILAAALPVGGCQASSARFTVEGTIYKDVGAGTVVVGDLPAGAWSLITKLTGFLPRTDTVLVSAGGDSAAEEPLDIGGGDGDRGCLSTGCWTGLHCNSADGRCYACLDDSHCPSGATCDPGTRTCIASSGGGVYCDSANTPSQCASGVLVPISGEVGYCSLSCPGGHDCPSGSECRATTDGPRCEVPDNCVDTRLAFGKSCFTSGYCSYDLFGGICLKAGGESGYCTAACASDQSCADAGLSGWTCRPRPGGTALDLYCQPPP
jgi:Cys-rich repeat protein